MRDTPTGGQAPRHRAFSRQTKPGKSLICPVGTLSAGPIPGRPYRPLAIQLARLLHNTTLYTKELHGD